MKISEVTIGMPLEIMGGLKCKVSSLDTNKKTFGIGTAKNLTEFYSNQPVDLLVKLPDGKVIFNACG